MQRMLATACAVMLASLAPAIELEDATPVDATKTVAWHDRSALAQKNTSEHSPENLPELRLASLTEGDIALPDDVADARPENTRDEDLRDDDSAQDTLSHPAPKPMDARDLTPEIPSLAALDAAFDVPSLPSLDALDVAFDNRPVELPPVPIPSRRPPTYAEMCEALASAATNHSLPAPFLIRLIWQESRFRHNVISHAGAQGIAQFMPATANDMGLDDPFNPIEALPVSARFLSRLIERFGNLGLAAAAYNAGPKRVLDWLTGKGQLPKETQDYVKTITGQPAEKWRKPEATASLQRVPPRAPCQREAGLYAANGPDRIPLPPDRTPEKTLVAAADKKTDSKTAKAKPATETRLAKAELATAEAKSDSKSETTSDAKLHDKIHNKADKPQHKTIQLAAMRRSADSGKGEKGHRASRHQSKAASSNAKPSNEKSGKTSHKQRDEKAAHRTKSAEAKPAASQPISLKPAAAKAQAQADANAEAKARRHAAKPVKKFATADVR